MGHLRKVVAVLLGLASLVGGEQAYAQEPAEMAGGTSAPVVATSGPIVETPSSVVAQAAAAPNPYTGDLLDRYRLTGDWWGARSALAEEGLTFDFYDTQFYQGVASGGQRRQFRYGGKLDYLFNPEPSVIYRP